MGAHEHLEEVAVLSSIYGDLVKLTHEGTSRLTARLREADSELTLAVSLPPNYPAASPPMFELSAPSLSSRQKDQLADRLQAVYLDNIGQPVLYLWIEACRDFLANVTSTPAADADLPDVASSSAVAETAADAGELPDILSGEPLTDRKSTFQAHVAAISNADQVAWVVSALRTRGKVARATHNMWAWRLEGVDGVRRSDCFDDGETGAGAKLLHLLDVLDARGVLVVVTRWYGGVHLGPDRFRHICNVARRALLEHGFIRVQVKPVDKPKKKHRAPLKR